jgi:CheY-like chemotaxis protein
MSAQTLHFEAISKHRALASGVYQWEMAHNMICSGQTLGGQAMPEGIRILVIDDSAVVRAAMSKALTQEGHSVTITGQTVGNARHLVNVDLVMLDYHMPGMNGRQVLESLVAACPPAKRPLFYLCTSDQDAALGARAEGFDGSFADKGDITSVVRQVASLGRLIRRRRG